MKFVLYYDKPSDPKVVEAGAEIPGEPKHTFLITAESDLHEVPGPVQVALYNSLDSKRQVKKFAERRVAAKKVYPLLPKIAKMQAKAPKGKSKAAASKKTSGESPAKGKRLGIGTFMAERIKAGDDTSVILDKVHKKFPTSKATAKDVSIIRGRVARKEL